MYISKDYALPPKNQVERVEAGKDNTSKIGDMGSFIKLFVAQMENQDPMKPNDGAEFFTQTAQISMVEQLTQMNSKNDKLQSTIDAVDRSLSSSYLGREIVGTVTDKDGPQEVSGVVSEVYFDNGKPMLGLEGGEKVELSDVIQVNAYYGL